MIARSACSGTGEETGPANACPTLFDLAVIGAGPSGALSAALAAEAGLKTIIIEKKWMPRPKPCGGFISARALDLLPPGFVASLAGAAEIRTVKVTWRGRTHSHHAEERLGLLVEREDFDRRLAQWAVQKGALLAEGITCRALSTSTDPDRGGPLYHLEVSGNTGGSVTLKTRSIIGADGALGNSGRLFGLRGPQKLHTGWGLTCSTGSGRAGQACGELNFYPLPQIGGMGWSFRGNGFTNRGVGGAVGVSSLKKHFHRIFPREINLPTAGVWPLPYLGPLRSVARDNLALVGDAAGLIELFSGEGLHNCFRSARFACQALATPGIDGGSFAAEYNRLFKHHFRKPFAGATLLALFLYGTVFLRPSALPGMISSLMNNRLLLRQDRGLAGTGSAHRDSP